jgi:lipoprotein signal peptidase
VQVTNLPAGDYAVTWTVELAGTLGAPEANNFQLLNGVTVVLASDNQAVAGIYNQPGVVITVPNNGSVSIQAIALGTVGAVYRAQLVVSLLAGGAIGNVLDGGQVVGVVSTGQDGVDVQWMGDDGIYIGTSVAVLASIGKLSGCVYVRDPRE